MVRQVEMIFVPAKQVIMLCALALVSSCSVTGPVITADQYGKIQEGMTYRQVVKIMGGPGDNSVNEAVESYSEYLFEPESMGKFYGWDASPECFVVVGFRNDSDGDDGNDKVDMKGQDPEGCLKQDSLLPR